MTYDTATNEGRCNCVLKMIQYGDINIDKALILLENKELCDEAFNTFTKDMIARFPNMFEAKDVKFELETTETDLP